VRTGTQGRLVRECVYRVTKKGGGALGRWLHLEKRKKGRIKYRVDSHRQRGIPLVVWISSFTLPSGKKKEKACIHCLARKKRGRGGEKSTLYRPRGGNNAPTAQNFSNRGSWCIPERRKGLRFRGREGEKREKNDGVKKFYITLRGNPANIFLLKGRSRILSCSILVRGRRISVVGRSGGGEGKGRGCSGKKRVIGMALYYRLGKNRREKILTNEKKKKCIS